MSAEWVICPNGCGEKLFHLEVSSHCLAMCRERREPCPQGCGELVKYRERDKHKMNACPHRFVKCKYAPQCKWTGLAKYLDIHLSEFMSLSEKRSHVGNDPNIDCQERPFVCWHPPLLPSADTFTEISSTDTTKVSWVGCGIVARFGDRSKHLTQDCPFRVTKCPKCQVRVIGCRLQEHLEGLPPSNCVDTSAWLLSGCAYREVTCTYVVSRPKDSEDNKLTASSGAVAQPSEFLETKSPQRERRPRTTGHSLDWTLLASDADREAQAAALSLLTVEVKQGCGLRVVARELEEHQAGSCPERHMYCPLGCGVFIRCKDRHAHEDADHLLQTELHLAAEQGELERVKDYAEGRDGLRCYSIGCRDDQANTALHCAVAACHPHIVRYLLSRRAQPDTAGLHGRTPLMLAAAAGNQMGLEMLIASKASPDARDSFAGWTPLHYAALRGHAPLIRSLLAARAAPSPPDQRRGDTPLHLALAAGHWEAAEALADGGADADVQNQRRSRIFYHTFDKATGRQLEVRRGDVPQDYARGDEAKRAFRSGLEDKLQAVKGKVTLDPLYGATVETAGLTRRPSPAKERALGRSPSPTRRGRSESPVKD